MTKTLFEPQHRSSRPLCLAVKAAKLTDPDRGTSYLKALHRSTGNRQGALQQPQRAMVLSDRRLPADLCH